MIKYKAAAREVKRKPSASSSKFLEMIKYKAAAMEVKRKTSASSSRGLRRPQHRPRRQKAIKRAINPLVIRQTEEFHSQLDKRFPSFSKFMTWTHVNGCFWMGLPASFCRMYLPQKDTYFILSTQDGKKYIAKYLVRNFGLSGGWPAFAKAQKLSQGDALVFQLVKPTKFKIYIIRESDLVEKEQSRVTNVTTNFPTEGGQSSNGGSMTFREELLFSNVTNFEEFKAAIYDLFRNFGLPYSDLQEYYELCSSQNAFLHAHLLESTNPESNSWIITKEKAKIIVDTISLASAMRKSKLLTFLQNFTTWDYTLHACGTFGMNVRFIHDRLHRLKSFAIKGEKVRSRYEEACHERKIAETEVKRLEVALAKFQELTAQSNHRVSAAEDAIKEIEADLAEFEKVFCHYDAHIDALELEVKTHELKFEEEASSPWSHSHNV